MTSVQVPADRIQRWVENFQGRHGTTALSVLDGCLEGSASDGSTFAASLPLGERYAGLPDPSAFAGAAREALPGDWGVLLVRKGGFAVARLSRARTVDSKVGKRHVQGRTKAGGQSQQRFARRRANQARAAFEAAAEHAARILDGLPGPLVTGGDRTAVADVLGDHRLARLADLVVGPWLSVPDPRRDVLEQAVRDASSVTVEVVNSESGAWPDRA